MAARPVTGELRQGALDSLVQEGVAATAGVPLAAVRRAAMLAGLHRGRGPRRPLEGGGRPGRGRAAGAAPGPADARLQRAPRVADAVAKAGGGRVAVDTKLDGIRIQVHRTGDDVLVVTRSLDDITAPAARGGRGRAGAPGRVGRARRRGARRSTTPAGRAPSRRRRRGRRWPPASPSRRTSSTCCTSTASTCSTRPGHERARRLERPGAGGPPGAPASSPTTSPRPRPSLADVLAAGHEGVVVKDLASPYDAGRRGAGWVKVKPVHTLDLVVLADRVGLRSAPGQALQPPPRRPRRQH